MKSFLYIFTMLLILASPAIATDDIVAPDGASYETNSTISSFISARDDMQDLESNEIPTSRYSRKLSEVRQLIDAQLALKESGGDADFSSAQSSLNELSSLYDNSFRAYDELSAFNESVSSFEGEDEMLDEFLDSASSEFEDERFERSIEYSESGFSRISELDAFETRLRTSYDAASRNILTFISNLRNHIMFTFLALLLFTILFHKPLRRSKLSRDILKLKVRRDVLQDMIASCQRSYFEDNIMSESAYHIKTGKYTEMIRDIDRQIPELKEQIAMLGGKGEKNG